MIELLKEKRLQLQKQLDTPTTHEDEIKELITEYETKLRNEFATKDACEKAKYQAQLDVVEELIEKEQENLSAQEQNEECIITNDNIEGE